jgi:hypothetical protein
MNSDILFSRKLSSLQLSLAIGESQRPNTQRPGSAVALKLQIPVAQRRVGSGFLLESVCYSVQR